MLTIHKRATTSVASALLAKQCGTKCVVIEGGYPNLLTHYIATRLVHAVFYIRMGTVLMTVGT